HAPPRRYGPGSWLEGQPSASHDGSVPTVREPVGGSEVVSEDARHVDGSVVIAEEGKRRCKAQRPGPDLDRNRRHNRPGKGIAKAQHARAEREEVKLEFGPDVLEPVPKAGRATGVAVLINVEGQKSAEIERIDFRAEFHLDLEIPALTQGPQLDQIHDRRVAGRIRDDARERSRSGSSARRRRGRARGGGRGTRIIAPLERGPRGAGGREPRGA